MVTIVALGHYRCDVALVLRFSSKYGGMVYILLIQS